jgi:CRISPR-associated protein (TIGR03986 family)
MNFHLPYHFVPFETPDAGTPRQDLRDRSLQYARHDRYVDGAWSGRILCRVLTETPIFIGSSRHENEPPPVRVDPYTLHGERAIPASSIRGMVGALTEAASNSAFRVLSTDGRYSVRKPMEPRWTLSAIGMIEVTATPEGKTEYHLRPLSIPTLVAERDRPAALPPEFQHLFPLPNMKVYVGNSSSIRDKRFGYRTYGGDKIYALRLRDRVWLSGYHLDEDRFVYVKRGGARSFILGQLPLDDQRDPLPYDQEVHKFEEDWVPGVMRVLGCWGNRTESMPHTKRHEIFLPWPQDPKWPVVKLDRDVVEEFEDLCNQRMEASLKAHERDSLKNPLLPFEPRDTRPSREGAHVPEEKRRIKVQHQDLVYFGVDSRTGEVNEISFSAIWRKAVKNGGRPATTGVFFPHELWPLEEQRTTLSAAELLLGFVEKQERDDAVPATDQRAADALASRVRFSAAVPVKTPKTLAPVTLHVLDAPKPPCPSLYFKPRNNPAGGFIPKTELDAFRHEPQGRKFYLHQPSNSPTEPWRTQWPDENKEQKCRISPIASGQEFFFHVDFENLSDAELELLVFSLTPSERFRHKIGMGKGIGLGSIHMQPLALFRVDRARRYTADGLAEPRYVEAILGVPTAAEHIPANYAAELEAAARPSGAGLSEFRERYRKRMSPGILRAIDLVGDPQYVRAPVLPPMLQDQIDPESETFKWFMANEQGQRQFLAPLAGRKDLPVLMKGAERKKEPGRW